MPLGAVEETDVNWFYAIDGERKGPVGQDEFNQLVAAGTIGKDTLVWREGMSDWKPYHIIALMGVPAEAEQAVALFTSPAAAAGEVNCTECGRVFRDSEVLDYAGRKICAECKPAFFQKLREGGEAAAMSNLAYAGFWIRVGAKIIDGLIFAVVMGILFGIWFAFTYASGGVEAGGRDAMAGLVGIQIVANAMSYLGIPMYNAFFIHRYGATPGKMACGLKVVRANGEKVTGGRAIGRGFSELLSGLICDIGYIIAAFDNPQKRALHDHICDTRVIYKNR